MASAMPARPTSDYSTSSPVCTTRTKLDGAGALLHAERQRYLRSAADMAETFRDLSGAVEHSLELAHELDFTLANLGYRFPDYPPASRRDPELLPASPHLERRPGPLSPLHRPRPDADREGAEDDREARARRLLPDRLGHHPLLPRAEHHGAGPRLGRQQRRVLRPVDHRRRPGKDGTALRALSLRGARRVARHRSRSTFGRPAREGHPVRLRSLRRARLGDDGQCHHLPRPHGGAGGLEGPRLLRGPDRPTVQATRQLALRRPPW